MKNIKICTFNKTFNLKITICLIFNVFFVLSTAHARPISFTDGITVMQQNNSDESKVHVHYSSSINDSFGITTKKQATSNPEEDANYTVGVQWNHLLHRKNTENSQTNVYSKTQLDYSLNNNNDLNYSVEIASDWESRRLFVAYSAKLNQQLTTEKQHQFSQSGRVGIAPYIADYNDLHTWLMVQVDNKPAGLESEKLIITPLVRFFKGDYLIEMGMNSEKDVLFNWIVRY